jgi:hypothetical protein
LGGVRGEECGGVEGGSGLVGLIREGGETKRKRADRREEAHLGRLEQLAVLHEPEPLGAGHLLAPLRLALRAVADEVDPQVPPALVGPPARVVQRLEVVGEVEAQLGPVVELKLVAAV